MWKELRRGRSAFANHTAWVCYGGTSPPSRSELLGQAKRRQLGSPRRSSYWSGTIRLRKAHSLALLRRDRLRQNLSEVWRPRAEAVSGSEGFSAPRKRRICSYQKHGGVPESKPEAGRRPPPSGVDRRWTLTWGHRQSCSYGVRAQPFDWSGPRPSCNSRRAFRSLLFPTPRTHDRCATRG